LIGGSTVIFSEADALDPIGFGQRLVKAGVTVLQGTPSMYQHLCATGWRPTSLRVLCGGEVLPGSLAAQLSSAKELWNLYGPTETTVWSSAARVEPGVRQPTSLPLGRPLANTIMEVLRDDLTPQVLDCEGELHIGGAGLADGYLGEPALTAAAFVADPRGVGGARLYRTGDRAIITSGGELIFCGRSDRQVKISGHRLELGDVEALLERLSSVRQAVVVTYPDGHGQTSLAAALLPVGPLSLAPPPEQIRRALREYSPNYAIPARLRWFDQLPSTANGKLDRVAIAQCLTTELRHVAQVEPARELTDVLRGCWREVLHQEVTDLDANFFDCGGASLQLLPLQRVINERTGVRIELAELLQIGSIRQLATHIVDSSPGSMRLPERDLESASAVARRRRAIRAEPH
jgi:acyl-coenzyme A synthetase/AMP-(fatty) acid ligase